MNKSSYRNKFSKERIISSDTNITTDIRAIAIYLPQFHTIEENSRWWGEGFTEWTNVRSADSYYHGHYQPHEPHSDIGYYDLNDESVLERQAQMAKEHGIEGFCFYYYWFQGKRLLEMPTDRLLATGKPDFPFCFCWANENWTRTWDGGDHEVLMSQDYSDENNEKIIRDLIPAFKDRRYIRVDGRPLFIVYRPTGIPNFPKVAKLWRKICREEGVGEIYLCGKRSFSHLENTELGLDASIQFPPLLTRSTDVRSTKDLQCRDGLRGHIHDYRELAALNAFPDEKEGKIFSGICPSWDNTARRKERATSWINSNPENYYLWLKTIVERTRKSFNPQERFIFINAWNEWAEGCHLEPDEKYGYAWLNATRQALCSPDTLNQNHKCRVLVVGHDAARAGAQIVLLTMLQEWHAHGHCDFQLVLLRDGVLRGEFENVCKTLVISDYTTEALQKAALDAFCSESPGVILANTVVVGPFLQNLKHFGAPIVTYVHELQKSIERWAPSPIMSATVKNSDHFIAVSDPVAENLHHTYDIEKNKISIINEYIKTSYQVSLPRLETLRSELEINPGELIVFGCGTMDWRKGPDLFAQTAKEVLKTIPEARFFWIGSDTGDEASTGAHGLTTDARIRFLGERENPRDYLTLGHVFFLSSREDPFPLVALEAADAGLPVVCFADAGGIPEFVGSTCGRTVPFENTQAAAAALVELLTQENLRKNTGLIAQTNVRAKHDAAQGSDSVFFILEGLIKRHTKSGESCTSDANVPTEPLVSVIVPNYNHAKYLGERLDSIKKQNYKNIEIILLDDGSTDKSVSILEDFTRNEPRARLIINESNSGSTFKQWKKGISEAKGKYIWIAESDDSADTKLLEILVGLLESDPEIMVATCQLRMMNPAGNLGGTPDEWLGELDADRWNHPFVNDGIDEIKNFLSKKNTILNASGVVFRNLQGVKSLIDDSMRLCADWLFWVRMLSNGKIAYTSEVLNYWRLQSSNARTKAPGVLELEEGDVIIDEIARILDLDQREKEKIKNKFNKDMTISLSNNIDGLFKKHRSWCPICEKDVIFTSKYDWLRDHYICEFCGSIPRERALMNVIETLYPDWRNLKIHESSPGNRGASIKLKQECVQYIASQYDPSITFGKIHPLNGYRSENLEKQTFQDEIFDIVISQDVMEHIFDAEAAFNDIHRTLKPGGAHIFTTPLVNGSNPTQRRAAIRPDGSVVHFFPPEFHGNPMSSEGSLVTWHWGDDIIQLCSIKIGAESIIHQPVVNPSMGIEGKYCEVIVAKKPLRTTAQTINQNKINT